VLPLAPRRSSARRWSPQDRIAADLNDIYGETSSLTLVGGRTALIVDPPTGRLPPALPQAIARAKTRPPHGYDDPETFSLDERCLIGTAAGSSQIAAPIVPNLFAQNYYQIVQTPDAILLFTEVVHDTRVVRMNAQPVLEYACHEGNYSLENALRGHRFEERQKR